MEFVLLFLTSCKPGYSAVYRVEIVDVSFFFVSYKECSTNKPSDVSGQAKWTFGWCH